MVLIIDCNLVDLHINILESLKLVCLAAFELKWRTQCSTSGGMKMQGNPISDEKPVSGIGTNIAKCSFWQYVL